VPDHFIMSVLGMNARVITKQHQCHIIVHNTGYRWTCKWVVGDPHLHTMQAIKDWR